MNLTKERRAIDTALDTYRRQLDTFTDERFTQTPPMGGWSYTEVYDHILKASLNSAIALECCTNNTCPPTKKGMNFWGHYVMFMGSFPPGKFKVPRSVSEKISPKKSDKEDIKNLIIKTRKKIELVAAMVNDAPKNARWAHPRLGMLNAPQWFKFIRVHLQHHLKQLERIKNNFAKG
ncbi:DinB family protein [Mucilaginibacter phyllosphaerae]|uniref:DinB family protein n=1 Tax=Mucilaginibacter phyllosphaerae TaxID=1812349 RepID=A0A4Y8AA17_9SPHI|nr:DinB family protein [Mucilaginibacter phyllosphaerae]MBB3969848.1 hypothetical protein [Mucilaginibacter phyllosphaerae]TEW65223.1 DinB family protein [Mucilaginibacter phyllosphaerae]GGH17183.1 hypothetical protein GCM10007352_27130 [Mucilaginibacter phyllosphaerae]